MKPRALGRICMQWQDKTPFSDRSAAVCILRTTCHAESLYKTFLLVAQYSAAAIRFVR